MDLPRKLITVEDMYLRLANEVELKIRKQVWSDQMTSNGRHFRLIRFSCYSGLLPDRQI